VLGIFEPFRRIIKDNGEPFIRDSRDGFRVWVYLIEGSGWFWCVAQTLSPWVIREGFEPSFEEAEEKMMKAYRSMTKKPIVRFMEA